MIVKPALSLFVLVAQLAMPDERHAPAVVASPQQHAPHQGGFGDYNGDGKQDSAFFVPAPYDSALARKFPDGPDPWHFFLRFSDPTLDSIPVHYSYDLHNAADLNGDGADELTLVQPVAKYYRVMSFNIREKRWSQLIQISSPREHRQPTEWVYIRSDTLYFLTNRTHESYIQKDRWEWTTL